MKTSWKKGAFPNGQIYGQIHTENARIPPQASLWYRVRILCFCGSICVFLFVFEPGIYPDTALAAAL